MASNEYDDVPDLASDSDDNEWGDIDFYDEDQMNMLEGDVACLFCDEILSSVSELFQHCRLQHEFDFVQLAARYNIDTFSYIKMINFLRINKSSPKDVIKWISEGGCKWSDDSYMKESVPGDICLMFDIESAVEEENYRLRQKSSAEPNLVVSNATGNLISRLQAVEQERDFLRQELQRATEEINLLKIAGQKLVMENEKTSNPVKQTLTNGHDFLPDENGYFASYSHHDIHMTMLKDTVRTEGYRDFMLKNPELFADKTVLDVGCGTGILSMFAVTAGAKRVVAVDQSNIIYQAMDIARENGMQDKIVFVKGKLEEVDLPEKKFDVIISEWMGYFLLFEAMLDSVLYARDKYLQPSGAVYPDKYTISLTGISDLDFHKSKVEFWDDVYGFRMSCMKSSVADEVLIRVVDNEKIVTEPVVIKHIDTTSCQVKDLEFNSDFQLQITSDSNLTGLVGYFDTMFDTNCSQKISFSTGPHCKPTHWEQALMILKSPLHVTKGSSISGKISFQKHPRDDRGYLIHLTIATHTYKYSLT